MHATSQFSHFRLAIAPGVPSSCLSTLLALQRTEEPDTPIAFFEASGDDLVIGLEEGRYDAGISLRHVSAPFLRSQPLWIDNMAVAMPLRSSLLGRATLTTAEVLDYPGFRWQAETCPLLDQRLSSFPPLSEQSMQHVLRLRFWRYGSPLAMASGSLRNRVLSAPMPGASPCGRFLMLPTRS